MLKDECVVFLYGESRDTYLRTSKFRLMEHWGRNNRVLYVEQPLHLFVLLKHPAYFIKRVRDSIKGIRRIGSNIYIYSTFYPLPYHSSSVLTSGRFINSINQASMLPRLRNVLKKLGFSKPILWFCLPHGADLVERLDNKLAVFHVVDEWSAFSGTPASLKGLEIDMLQKADMTIVTSEKLYESKKKYAKEIHLVRHAVDVNTIAKVFDEGTAEPDDIKGLPRPRLLYCGAMHKLDLGLIEYIVGSRPQWSFIFIGERKGPQAAKLGRLPRYKNFHFLGPKEYALLPGYFKHIDVFIMPFQVNELTMNMCPIKMYEFFATGKPVVSVDLPEIRALSRSIYPAGGKEEFLAAIDDAVGTGSNEIGPKAFEWAAANSWEERIGGIERLMECAISKKERDSSLKKRSKEWWEAHPMDYENFANNDSRPRSDDEYKDYFENIDRRFYRDAYFAHGGGAVFSRLIDYDLLMGKKVLEVGCGMGSIAAEFARHGSEVTAMDISFQASEMTKTRFGLYGLGGSIVNSDAEHLPFKDGEFDYVWSWGVLHHTPNIKDAVREIYRVLKPGGKAAVMLYNKNSIYNYLNVTLRYGILQMGLLRESIQQLRNRYTDGKDIGGCPLASYYSKSEAKQLFSCFRGAKVALYNQKEGIVNMAPEWTGLRPFLYRAIPDAFYDFVFSRLGFAMFIEAQK